MCHVDISVLQISELLYSEWLLIPLFEIQNSVFVRSSDSVWHKMITSYGFFIYLFICN